MGARGSIVVGAFGLLLLFQGLTGLYLWWPLMNRPRWGFAIRWSRPWVVVGYDLHKALGAASLAFHLPIAATGALLGLAALVPEAVHEEPALARMPARPPLPLDALAREAERALPGGRLSAFRFAGDSVVVTMRMPGELDVRGASVVVLGASDGRVVSVIDGRQAPWATRVWTVAKAVHIGDFGGTPVRALYVLGGLASVGLSLSGYVLALARARRD